MHALLPAIFTFLAAPTSSDATIDHEFWVQFAEGNPAIDVTEYLPDGLVAELESPEGDTVELFWIASSAQFALEVNGQPLTDEETDYDQWQRPTYAAGFNGPPAPTYSGLVDVAPSGDLMVELTEGQHTMRCIVNSAGQVTEQASCKCPSEAGYRICIKQDCETEPRPECSIHGHVCTWMEVQ